MRYKLYHEAITCATLLDGLVVVDYNGKTATRCEHEFGKLPGFAKHLRTWGEAGTVTIPANRKLSDRGVHCMMVGYSLKHPADCYRMWDPATNGVHLTRDVIWLRRMFYSPTRRQLELNVSDMTDVETGPSDAADSAAGESVDISDAFEDPPENFAAQQQNPQAVDGDNEEGLRRSGRVTARPAL